MKQLELFDESNPDNFLRSAQRLWKLENDQHPNPNPLRTDFSDEELPDSGVRDTPRLRRVVEEIYAVRINGGNYPRDITGRRAWQDRQRQRVRN
ncbi:hypothetical protein ACKTEK_05790 [Tepidamorphus sp. 3E244]|uniref:hypothetical protein n=1 Tax=Tepidamorphus sp. 3E244 TaxID=3385498 RepID=UPI0038FC2741